MIKEEVCCLLFCLFQLVLTLFSNAQAAEQIVLKTVNSAIYGTLETPKGTQPVPVALIISGSGPTDRDGNSAIAGKNNSLKMLAEVLAAKGIASVRYDKRGVAARAGIRPKEEEIRFEVFIKDAEEWGRLLLQDRRFSMLIITGHSEGALIGSVACKRIGAQGFISIAGAGRPAFEVIYTQLKKNTLPELLSEANIILDHLKKGETTDRVPPSLMYLFRPSIQPYLISWFRYDPAHELSQLTVPVLIVQGTTDLQVSILDAELLSKANKSARLLIIDGMNHVLKTVPNDLELQIKSYSNPGLPIPSELTDKMAAFIKELNDKK